MRLIFKDIFKDLSCSLVDIILMQLIKFTFSCHFHGHSENNYL